jgi:hypothetical protein
MWGTPLSRDADDSMMHCELLCATKPILIILQGFLLLTRSDFATRGIEMALNLVSVPHAKIFC